MGESGSRTTIMTGYAVVEAARDLKKQIAEKGLPKGSDMLTAIREPRTRESRAAKSRNASARISSKWKWTPNSGRVRVTKYLAVHDCGRIMNPLTATSQIKGGAIMGIGMALHEDLLYDRASRPAADGRLLRRAHLDASATRPTSK